MGKAAEAFRTISEVADDLEIPKHVLRFWEVKFPQIRPMKRGGGRRFYRPEDLELLRGIRHLLHAEGYTIKGVQKILREQGIDHVKAFGKDEDAAAPTPAAAAQAETPPPAQRRARGTARGATAKPSTAREMLVTAPRSTSSTGEQPPRGNRIEILIAAVKELEACRAVLTGGTATAVAPSQVPASASAAAQRRGSRASRS